MIWLLVSRLSPTLYLQSLLVCDKKKKKKILLFALLHLCLSLSSAVFSLDSSLMCCVHSSRSSCHLQSLASVIKGFHCVWETWRAGLPTALSRRSPARPPLYLPGAIEVFVGDQASPVCGSSVPHRPVVKTVPCIRPRHHCHSSTTDTTQCQKCCSAMSPDESFPN